MKRNGFIVFTIFFSVIGITITCNMLLFLHYFEIEEEVIYQAAPITFVNCLIWTLIYCVIDGLRRYYTLQQPINHIQKALLKVMQGDYVVQIKPALGNKELNEVIKSLNTMIKQLSSVDSLQSDFISNVSHEFKTPLSVIRNYAVLLDNPKNNHEEISLYTHEIIDQTQKLSQLVSNILRLNQLENQHIAPNMKVYHLTEQIRESILNFEMVWEEKEIEMDIELQEDVLIYADSDLLSIVWDNLISNALKFTSRHGKVRIQLYEDKNDIFVRVEDTGKGIEASKGRYIFDKFYQTDMSHSTHGNGLGLALVKRVIGLCQGEISVQSEINKGSIFCVKLNKGVNANGEI